jgi:predicted transcriptional regulator
MIAISLKLPDDLAEASTKLADQIGITRTELIRRALRHTNWNASNDFWMRALQEQPRPWPRV